MSNKASQQIDVSTSRWNKIEELVAQISNASKTDVPFEAFARESLNETMLALSAAVGVVWRVSGEREWEQVYEANFERFGAAADDKTRAAHRKFLESVAASEQSSTKRDPQTAHVWIAAPFVWDHQVGVIEIIRVESHDPREIAGAERLLTMVSELFCDFLQRSQLRGLKEELNGWQQYEMLVQRVQASLDLQETAFQIVNDGRLFVGCDRASLLIARDETIKTIAISGVESVERRSEQIRSLESLARAVGVSRRWLRYEGNTDELPPQLEQPVSRFADASHAQSVDVVPLISSGPCVADATASDSAKSESLVGVLILERFDSVGEGGSDTRIARLAQLSALAVRNSLDYSSLPFLSVARLTRRWSRFGANRGRRIGIWVGLAIVIATLVCMIPVPFAVHAEGELQPRIRRDLFSPDDAKVVEVQAEHGDIVKTNDVLVTLRSRDLDLELQRLQGQFQATQKKLLGLAAARIRVDSRESDARFPGQLAAEEEELKQLLSSQEKQISIVKQQREQLTIRSPIDGRVLTWNPQELLEDRPVARGQLLLRVADPDGPWVVELNVPDREAGHVIEADKRGEEPLICSFTPAGSDDRTYNARVESIASRTEITDGQFASVRIVATISREDSLTLRPGATVYAKLNSGKKSIGYVLFHDLSQTIRRVLWY